MYGSRILHRKRFLTCRSKCTYTRALHLQLVKRQVTNIFRIVGLLTDLACCVKAENGKTATNGFLLFGKVWFQLRFKFAKSCDESRVANEFVSTSRFETG